MCAKWQHITKIELQKALVLKNNINGHSEGFSATKTYSWLSV